MDEGKSLGVEQDSRVHGHGVGEDDKVHTRIVFHDRERERDRNTYLSM